MAAQVDQRVGHRRPDTQRIAIIERQKILHRSLENLQAVFVQPQILDDLRVQQADGVAGRGIAKAGVELLGDRRAADDATTLENPHFQAGFSQITGAGQPVVAGADDEGIKFLGRGLAAG